MLLILIKYGIGTSIKDLDKRKMVEDKRNSCGNYQRKYGGCLVLRGKKTCILGHQYDKFRHMLTD